MSSDKPKASSSTSSTSSVGPAVGGGVGASLLLLLVVAILCSRRRRKTNNASMENLTGGNGPQRGKRDKCLKMGPSSCLAKIFKILSSIFVIKIESRLIMGRTRVSVYVDGTCQFSQSNVLGCFAPFIKGCAVVYTLQSAESKSHTLSLCIDTRPQAKMFNIRSLSDDCPFPLFIDGMSFDNSSYTYQSLDKTNGKTGTKHSMHSMRSVSSARLSWRNRQALWCVHLSET